MAVISRGTVKIKVIKWVEDILWILRQSSSRLELQIWVTEKIENSEWIYLWFSSASMECFSKGVSWFFSLSFRFEGVSTSFK